MNTPSELFDFYETYLNMYEEADKKKPKPTVLPRSRETDIGDQTTKGWNDRSMAELDWDEKQIKRPTNSAAQASRLRKIVGTQRRQDIESGVRNEDVEYVLDYLIDEGFTDSYESAIEIVEAMSDEWLECIIDERTRYAKETGKSATSGRPSERGGLKNQSGDVRKAALLHVMKKPPSGAGVRMGASGQPIPGGGSGSRQTKKERGAKVKETPKTYVTSTQKEEMRKRAEDNIGSRFD
jgi:hypothetical protein